MCSNFQSISRQQADWVLHHFQCELPYTEWPIETYPSYLTPFIRIDGDRPICELARFGLIPAWAANKPKFGLKTYNSRSETVADKPSYRNAWNRSQFGLAIMQSFYEPRYDSDRSVRWRIKRKDSEPMAVASIWERFIDRKTNEPVFSFSMLTVNADGHELMKHFHRPDDEKRSIIILDESEYKPWLMTNNKQAKKFLHLAQAGILTSEAAPRPSKKGN